MSAGDREASADSPPAATGPLRHRTDYPVVGIGASAGGLAALLRFFERMPDAPGMAFVIVLHLSPKHESTIDRLLQAATKMPVRQVQERVRIERNHVYVIPPTYQLVA